MTAEDQKNRLNKDQISVEQIRLNRKLDIIKRPRLLRTFDFTAVNHYGFCKVLSYYSFVSEPFVEPDRQIRSE